MKLQKLKLLSKAPFPQSLLSQRNFDTCGGAALRHFKMIGNYLRQNEQFWDQKVQTLKTEAYFLICGLPTVREKTSPFIGLVPCLTIIYLTCTHTHTHTDILNGRRFQTPSLKCTFYSHMPSLHSSHLHFGPHFCLFFFAVASRTEAPQTATQQPHTCTASKKIDRRHHMHAWITQVLFQPLSNSASDLKSAVKKWGKKFG